MKVGIITFHFAINYGAVLQAYGLKSALESLGHEVSVLDYKPDYLSCWRRRDIRPGFRSLNSITGLKLWFKYILKKTEQDIRVRRFDSFNKKYLNLHYYSGSEIPQEFAVVVYGSDQIWNPLITGGNFDPVLFGDVKNTNSVRIAYAASVGSLSNISGREHDFINLLNKFDFISSRESNLAEMISNSSSKHNPICTIDPTLLAGKQVFDQIASRRIISEKYLLYFDFFNIEQPRIIAKNIAKKNRLKFIELSPCIRTDKNEGTYSYASPAEFCSFIKYADKVITTSFHGTALSILFNKDFYSIEVDSRFNDRILNLLDSVHIKDRFISKDGAIKNTKIHWDDVNNRLHIEREKSLNYIVTALDSARNNK